MRLWHQLGSDRVLMLGVDGAESGHARPMMAQVGDIGAPLYFFTSLDDRIVGEITGTRRAVATFVSRGYELFASLHGRLRLETDRAAESQRWDKEAARRFNESSDPELRLLRLDVDQVQIWSAPPARPASAVIELVRPTRQVVRDGFAVHIK